MTSSPSQALVLVGGGPRSTYVLGDLVAALRSRPPRTPLAIHVFEVTGSFGSGWVHSSRQPRHSLLNRPANEISLGSNADPGSSAQTDLASWLSAAGRDTTQWRPRADHGIALEERFAACVTALRTVSGVSVTLHTSLVLDIEPDESRYCIRHTAGTLAADGVFLLIGHETGHRALQHGERPNRAPYPLEATMSACRIPSGRTVHLAAAGLTAMDQVLALTAGRGGRFCPDASGLTYQPSGREPASIVLWSRSGLLPLARPEDAGTVVLDEHPGVLTGAGLERLRQRHGLLDFQSELWPLLLAECAYQYFRAVVGSSVWGAVADAALGNTATWHQIERLAAEDPRTSAFVEGRLLSRNQLFQAYVLELREAPANTTSEQLLRINVQSARLGLADDPLRRALDITFRGLRPLIQELVDDFGLCPESDALFRRHDFPRISRLVNGTSRETLSRLLALVDAGVVQIRRGQSPPEGVGWSQPLADARVPTTTLVERDTLLGRLARSGVVRQRRVERADALPYHYPGVWVGPHSRAIQEDGTESAGLVVLGAPLEGQRSFQFSAAKPTPGHDVLATTTRAVSALLGSVVHPDQHPAPGPRCLERTP
jgi:uncharacterized NAD(P)/FAD-binding protein YdhS